MADEDDAGEKTEEATDRRREDFREQGQLAKSQDLNSFCILLAGLAYLFFLGGFLYDRLASLTIAFLDGSLQSELNTHEFIDLMIRLMIEMLFIAGPMMILAFLMGFVSNVMQIGFLITFKPLEPKIDKLNFFGNFFKTFFNSRAFANLATSLLKMAVIFILLYFMLRGDAKKIAQLPLIPLMSGMEYLISRIFAIFFNILFLFLIVAIGDFLWQKWNMEKKMMMSKQEIKDEFKMTEGNPQIKSQRRKRALDMLNQKMMSSVPQADVVINNPTHFSVALKYRQGVDAAPIVVAKGADLMALRIRRLAESNEVPMIDNAPLARALYKQVKVGRSVPLEFYRAVAEVLAFVYKLRREKKAKES